MPDGFQVSWISYPLAVAASGVNATSNLLQRAANQREPDELSMTPRLLLDLIHQPLWLAGFGSVIGSFVLVAAALDFGRLAAVEPIIVLELPLTLLAASRFLGARLRTREWVAIAAMTAGLGGFVFSLHPSGGTHGRASALEWVLGGVITVVPILVLGALGLRSKGPRRAGILGITTGLTFGLTSAFMKGMTASLHAGIVGVLSSWETYAMAVTGLAGMYLLQSALQAGRLVAAQPGITLCEPAVGILWGIFAFKESTRGGLFVLAAVACAGLVGLSTLVLARCPALAAAKGAAAKGAGGSAERPSRARAPERV